MVLIDKMVALLTLINLVVSLFLLLRQASKDKHYERTICRFQRCCNQPEHPSENHLGYTPD